MISKKNYLTKHRLIVSYVQLDCQMLIPNNAWPVKTYVYQARSLFLCGHFCKCSEHQQFSVFTNSFLVSTGLLAPAVFLVVISFSLSTTIFLQDDFAVSTCSFLLAPAIFLGKHLQFFCPYWQFVCEYLQFSVTTFNYVTTDSCSIVSGTHSFSVIALTVFC